MVARTKSKIACFGGPSFQDASKPPPDIAVCASPETGRSSPNNAGSNASVEMRTRRVAPEEGAIGFMFDSHAAGSITGRRVPELLHGLFDRKAAGLLPRRELPEALHVLRHERLRRNEHERVLDEPTDVIAGLVLGPLERVGA